MRRFFIQKKGLSTPTPRLSPDQARHIKNVLRLKPGDTIRLFDGTGVEYDAEIMALSDRSVEVSILQRVASIEESPAKITVAQAVLKVRKMDLLVRQLTELGASEWIPFISKRSVPKPDIKRLVARSERWKKIVVEALKQSNRGRLTQIGNMVTFEDILRLRRAYDLKIIFWENESKRLDQVLSFPCSRYPKILAMIGPEGGFTPKEIKAAASAGMVVASLGPRILRADTASIAACVLLQYLFGDMGKNLLTKNHVFNR